MVKTRKKSGSLYTVSLLLVTFTIAPVHATDYESCLLNALRQAADEVTIGVLKTQCENLLNENEEYNEFESALAIRMADEKIARKNRFVIIPHKPNYILPLAYNSRVNTAPFDSPDKRPDNAEVKFQVSFKFSVLENLFGNTGDLYFAYTNQSYWQAYNWDASSPFREINHEPEVFLLFDPNWQFDSINKPLKNVKIALGVLHQSNGRDADISRSWNRLYANFVLSYSNNLFFSIKPWWRIPEPASIDDNPDIDEYLGYGEFRMFYIQGDKKMGLMFRDNLQINNNRAAIEINYSFPLRKKIRGYVQYFNGYGESLIDYNASVNRLSLGVLLTTWL